MLVLQVKDPVEVICACFSSSKPATIREGSLQTKIKTLFGNLTGQRN